MPETFFILLAGGILLAAAIPKPGDVTLNWLRLAGILALAMEGLSIFFIPHGEWPRSLTIGVATIASATLAQLAFAQIGYRNGQRAFAAIGFLAATFIGSSMLLADRAPAYAWPIYVSAVGIAAMTGLVLMDMLLGHAYLTASRMTMAPFMRLTLSLALATIMRAGLSVAGVLILQHLHPVEMLWGVQGLFILTRWLVGLFVPAVFIYMTYDCVRRRSTQSATGILYVAGVLVFLGEITALYLVRATGLPF